MPPNAQAASTAPKQREITCVHEAGHAVVGHWLFGAVAGVRLDSGGGVVWFDDPPPEDRGEIQEAVRTAFTSTEDLLELGPMPPRFVAKHFAKWRANTIVFLAGPEAERLAFGLTLSPENSDQLSAKMYCRRLSVSRAGANLLFEHCKAEARAILQMRWPAVEAIARALDREDELDGEEVAKLIERNPPLR